MADANRAGIVVILSFGKAKVVSFRHMSLDDAAMVSPVVC